MTEIPAERFSRNESNKNSTTHGTFTIFEVLKRPKILVICLVLLVLILSSVLSNLTVCYTIFRTKRLQCATYYLVASLAVSDFGVGVFVIPVSLAYNLTFEMKGTWVFGVAVCDIWMLANFWLCSASIFNLCAVTWDRYIAVTSPLRYTTRMRTSRVIRMLVATWTLSLASSSVNFYGIKTSEARKLCEIKGLPLRFVIYDFIFVFLLPIFGIIFVNAKLWVIAIRQIKRIQVQVLSIAMAPFSTQDTHPQPPRKQTAKSNLTSRSTIKIFRTVFVLTGSFVCCMTPFFATLLVDSLIEVPGFVLYVVVIITYVNSATNPWIYGIWNKDFRDCVAFVCLKKFRRFAIDVQEN